MKVIDNIKQNNISKDQIRKLINKPGQVIDQIRNKYTNPKHPRYRMTRVRFDWIMGNVKGPRVLDIGCGVGLSAELCMQRDDIEEFHGVDRQAAAILEARKVVQDVRVNFYNGWGEETPFKDEYFDTVIMSETLEHVHNVEEAVSEVYRVLKFGGSYIVTIPYAGRTSDLHVRGNMDESFIKDNVGKYFDIVDMELFKKGVNGFKVSKLHCLLRKTTLTIE